MDLMAPIRVVIVDDELPHLIAIANGLALAGIPCVWHWYNRETATLVPPAPADGYPHLRLLITDLNIREMAGANNNPANLAGIIISEVLQPLVAKDGGPYSIVLWTSTGVASEEVKPLIFERINTLTIPKADRRPAPLSISVLAKGQFIPPSVNLDIRDEFNAALTSMFEHSTANPGAFKHAIDEATSTTPILSLVAGWESRVSLSASSIMNSLHNISVEEAANTEASVAKALESIIAKLAMEAVGSRNAVKSPSDALNSGLLDLVVDDLISNKRPAYAQLIKDALDAALQAIPAPSVKEATKNRLNTHLHLELSPEGGEILTRGAVFSIKKQSLKKLTGQSSDKILQDEFLFEGCNANLLAKSKVLLVEVGADCDHANRKPRTIRLLLAAEMPYELFTAKQKKDLKKYFVTKNDSLEHLGPWLIHNKDLILVISTRRFVTVQEWECPSIMKMKYRLRKPLVDLVLYKYTTHSNRPGIISITS